MGLAKITRVNEVDLTVECDGHQYRRIAGSWQMLGNSGTWFDCTIPDSVVRNQVADFDACLRSYDFSEGPDYPRGRRAGESIASFIRRLQAAELAAASKGIFKPVSLRYDSAHENAKRHAAAVRKIANAPFPSKYLTQ